MTASAASRQPTSVPPETPGRQLHKDAAFSFGQDHLSRASDADDEWNKDRLRPQTNGLYAYIYGMAGKRLHLGNNQEVVLIS